MTSTYITLFCVIFFGSQLDLQRVQGYTLMQHLAQQANSLQYGLNLAKKYNIRGSSARIAFSARTSSNLAYSSGNIVSFPYVITNQGYAFKNSKYFQAPHSGMYVFSWSIRTVSSGNKAYTSIRVNGSIKQQSYCYTGTSSYSDSCSTTVVLSLNKYDKVSIYSDSSSAYVAATYSSFAGWEL
ncbi:uncharacterized protein LOC134280228 [Saccostrea cucullata]|uniref:uncharacterized protein LOC134280228 n=1 Tax=Saccostrea cuccullata TaxID=36930 RepID=UPI002ED1E49D